MIGQLMTLVLTLAYPALVFITLTFWNVRGLGFVLLAFGILRTLHSLLRRTEPSNGSPPTLFIGVALILFALIILWTRHDFSARLYPAIINLGMLCWFGWSLLYPPTVIERIARTIEPDLPHHAVAYTRRVTLLWCVFFVLNGMAALYTSLYSSLEVWTLYNGLIAYLLMGTLFAGEYLIRRKVRAKQEVILD